jgi:hypothetical protein
MGNSIYLKIVKSKLFIFIIQISILLLIIFSFHYTFQIEAPFLTLISPQRRTIIQLLGNLILYNDLDGLILIYSSWILISFIPIIIYKEARMAFSANIKAIFFPNFFFYIFLYKYLPSYFEQNFWNLFLRTLSLFTIIAIVSLVIPFLYQRFRRQKKSDQIRNLRKIAQNNKYQCPYCGTIFNSKPLYCYNCSRKLPIESLKEGK